mgnify:CR=1 FL=1
MHQYNRQEPIHGQTGQRTSSNHNLDQAPEHSTSCCALQVEPRIQVLLSTALVKVRDTIGNVHTVRALLDSCSQSNFITDSCVQRLNLKKIRTKIPVQGVNNLRATSNHTVSIEICSNHSEFRTELNCLVLPKISSDLPDITIDSEHWGLPEGLPLADPAFNQPGKIDMLIGAEVFFHLLRQERMTKPGNYPVLQNTQLGWILAGRFEHKSAHLSTSNTSVKRSFFLQSNTTLEEKRERVWEHEQVDEKPKPTNCHGTDPKTRKTNERGRLF